MGCTEGGVRRGTSMEQRCVCQTSVAKCVSSASATIGDPTEEET